MTSISVGKYVKDIVHNHASMELLEDTFGNLLKKQLLSRKQIKYFLACHIAGVRDVPTSILNLALRVSHECMKYDYFGGHAIAARTLLAAVHEYGLHNTEKEIAKTHFELYRDAINSWGFTENEVLNHDNIFMECKSLVNFNECMAKDGPIASALACHIALEETADKEFFLLWEGFSKFWEEYGLSGPDDAALGFYKIHIAQEPMHAENSIEALDRYLELVPCHNTDEIFNNVTKYLNLYKDWIYAFKQYIL